MATTAEKNRDPWGRSLVETLRRWWWVPVAAAVVGALLGGIAGFAGPKTAEAMVRVQTQGDNQSIAQAIQSAVLESSTREVYTTAAAAIGVDVPTLRSHSEIASVLQSSVLSIKATDRDADRAAQYANALADAAVNVSNKRIEDELKALTDTTNQLVRNQRLTDPNAEQQRIVRLGDALADSQGRLLLQSRRLALLQRAEAAQATRVSPVLLTGMGAVGGGLLGVAVALLFGGRRGTIGSIGELRRVYPELEFVPARELPTIMSMEGAATDRVVLSGVRSPAGAIRGLVEPVAAGLRAAGRDVVVTEDVAQLGTDARLLDGRLAVTILQAPLSSAIIKRAGRDERALLLVLVRPHKTRFEWLDEYVYQFGDRSYVVVD